VCVCVFICCAEHDDVERMIIGHLEAIQHHPMLKGAYKHVIIEANMSYISADEIASWCRRKQFTNMLIESRDPKGLGRVGIWTGPWEKESYAYTARDAIKELDVCFSTHMIGNNIEKDKKQLIAQLRNFRLDLQEPNDPSFGKYKYSFTGKTRGGQKDDRVLAMMMMMYWGDRKREDAAFLQIARQNGIRL
jgi:hypothetical protein